MNGDRVCKAGVSRETSHGIPLTKNSYRLNSLSDTKFPEDKVEHVFHIHPAGNSAEAPGGKTQIFDCELR